MPRIQILHAIFPDPTLKSRIERRLTRFLRRLFATREEPDTLSEVDDTDDDDLGQDASDKAELSWSQRQRISRRADRIVACANRTSPLSLLKPEDRRRLEVLRDGVELVGLPSEHRADEIAAELHARFPWLAPATEQMWHALSHSAQSGEPGVRLPPFLLFGPPGIAKSAWARTLAELIGVPRMVFDASCEGASFGLVGSQRGWGNAAPGRLLNFILAEKVANGLVVIDEVEKAGRVTSIKGQTFALTDALLPLLEPLSARSWSCPFFEIGFDMSWVIWVLTCNDYRTLPDPLLSRCPPIRLSGPTCADLKVFVRIEGVRRGLSEASLDAICEVLDRIAARGHVPDLRSVIRMLDRAERLERRRPLQ